MLGAMRIAASIGGEVRGAPMALPAMVEQAQQSEADGFPSAWTTHFSRGPDALSIMAVAGTRTSHIELGVGVVPTYPRHPHTLAQQAATVQVFCGGRLTLGVGVSHRPVIEGLFGIPYAKPAAHMREYLSVLVPLLREGNVSFRGEFYTVEGGFSVAGTSPVPVLVGALSPKMIQVAGELADGSVTWLAGPRTVESVVVPGLREAAAAAGRPAPRVVAGVPVAVCDDAAEGRAVADQVFARYNGLTNYRQVMEREGVGSVADLTAVGTESEVEKQLRRYADAGATELWPVVFPVGDAEVSMRRSTQFLAGLAPEL
jgi:F420-dependent oxidoreductase-like protein